MQISQMTRIFFFVVCPTDFTEFHRFLPYAGWDFADVADFLLFSWWFREKSVTLSAEI